MWEGIIVPIPQPSQLQCDKMEPGDIVFVKNKSRLYKLIRNLFFKNKPKIRVRDGWGEPTRYNEFYQEDCVLLYSYETQCIQSFDNEISCIVALKDGSPISKVITLKNVQVGLYNLQLNFGKYFAVTIPISEIDSAIQKNKLKLNSIQDARKIKELLKFQRYKGTYFKNYVERNAITNWTPTYCSICGKSVDFTFESECVIVKNNCDCGCLKLNMEKLSYDELSIWYYNQINPAVKKVYDDFWFKRCD